MASVPPRTITLRNGTAVTIRTAQASDAPALHEHFMRLAREGTFEVTLPDEVRPEPDLRRKLARHLEEANDLCLVAHTPDGSLVADLLATGSELRRMAHRVRFGLSVAPEHRDVGLGRALIQTLLDWARRHPEIEKVTLNVFAGNARAIALYRSLGFVDEGLRRREIRLAPGVYSDDHAMALFVKP